MTCLETPLLAAQPWPEHLVAASRRLLEAELDALRQSPQALALAEAVLRRFPEHRADMARASEAVGAELVDLTLANLSYDAVMGSYGCSTVALATPDGPVVARNMDWSPEALIARASAVVPTRNGLNAGPVGCVGVVTGLSRGGFAVVLNAVSCAGLNAPGYPVLLFLRHLIDEARDFDDALGRAQKTPLLSSALITLVGTRNDQRAVVERSSTQAAVRRPRGDEPLVTTNHYLALEGSDGTCDRFLALSRWSRELPTRPTVEDLLGVLTRPPLYNGITAQHIVIHPAAGWMRMWVPAALLEGGAHAGQGGTIARLDDAPYPNPGS